MKKHILTVVPNGQDEIKLICNLCDYERAVPLFENGTPQYPGVSVNRGDLSAIHKHGDLDFSIEVG